LSWKCQIEQVLTRLSSACYAIKIQGFLWAITSVFKVALSPSWSSKWTVPRRISHQNSVSISCLNLPNHMISFSSLLIYWLMLSVVWTV
jgi:hypothetical protein